MKDISCSRKRLKCYKLGGLTQASFFWKAREDYSRRGEKPLAASSLLKLEGGQVLLTWILNYSLIARLLYKKLKGKDNDPFEWNLEHEKVSSRSTKLLGENGCMLKLSCMAESLHCSSETITTLFISYTCMLNRFSRVRLFVTPWAIVHQAPLCPWDSPGKNTGVGCHFLLQEIFPTQGLNPGLLNCRQTLGLRS